MNDTHAELAALQSASMGGATYGGQAQSGSGAPLSTIQVNQLNMSNQATLSSLRSSRDIQGQRPQLSALRDMGAPISQNLHNVSFSAF